MYLFPAKYFSFMSSLHVDSLWDGLLSGQDRILVLGATNRPNDIDSAILRRMPKRFAVGLPDLQQRIKILSLVCVFPSLFVPINTDSSTDTARY